SPPSRAGPNSLPVAMGKGDRDRDREKLRQERIAAEESAKSSGRNRLIATYAIASTVVIAIVVVIVLVASGGDDEGGGDAHINLNTSVGSTNGVQPDNREGIVPAAAKTTDLEAAAKAAGCKLELRLKDEGAQHIPAGSKTPDYQTNP